MPAAPAIPTTPKAAPPPLPPPAASWCYEGDDLSGLVSGGETMIAVTSSFAAPGAGLVAADVPAEAETRSDIMLAAPGCPTTPKAVPRVLAQAPPPLLPPLTCTVLDEHGTMPAVLDSPTTPTAAPHVLQVPPPLLPPLTCTVLDEHGTMPAAPGSPTTPKAVPHVLAQVRPLSPPPSTGPRYRKRFKSSPSTGDSSPAGTSSLAASVAAPAAAPVPAELPAAVPAFVDGMLKWHGGWKRWAIHMDDYPSLRTVVFRCRCRQYSKWL